MRGLKVIRAVVTKGSRLVGHTVAEVEFRETYKSAIVAVQQGGRNTSQALSTVKFTVGDVLVLQASEESPLLVQPPDDFYKKDKRNSGTSGRHSRSSSFVNLVTRRFGSHNNLADAEDVEAIENGVDAGFFIEDGGEPDSESSDGVDPERQVSFPRKTVRRSTSLSNSNGPICDARELTWQKAKRKRWNSSGKTCV